MFDESFVIRIGGEAGEGIVTIGETFVRIAAYSGLEVYTFHTYPAEIEGGRVMFQARIGRERVLSQGDEVDVLVAMDQEAYDEHRADLRESGVLVYDSAGLESPPSDLQGYPVPARSLADSIDWSRGKNLVMIGALAQLFGLGLDRSEGMVRRRLGRFTDVLDKNLAALRLGFEYAAEQFPQRPSVYLQPPEEPTDERLVMTGDQAIALGALAAGCRFFAGYPITPATPIMEFMARELPRFGGTLVQAEDEIAAISMVLGASFAGVKAMTATSGPGLALMIESLGHASMTETPAVIVDVQRAGPSTGIPTKTAQGDLFLALYGGNDEAPRFVIAPDSVEDGFYQMVNAFNLAETFQMPVIVLSDQAMAPRVETIPPLRLDDLEVMERLLPTLHGEDHYRRYELTDDGVSPMAIPGMANGRYTAEGLEHGPPGAPDYSPEVHRVMMEKRYRKVETARALVRGWDTVTRWGDPEAELGIMGWGSTRGAVREAMVLAAQAGIRVEALYTKMLLPMPDDDIRDFLRHKRAIIVPELNYTGQFAKVIEHRYNLEFVERAIHLFRLTKYEGLPFKIREVYDKILAVADDLVSGVLAHWQPPAEGMLAR